MPDVRGTVINSGGDVEMTDLLNRGDAQIAFEMLNSVKESYDGTGAFEGNKNLRLFLVGQPAWNICVVPAESDIKTIADLKGKTVSIGGGGSSCATLMSPMQLKAYGLSLDDVNEHYLSGEETVTGLKDGTLDAGFFYLSPPAPALMDITTSKKVRFLGLGEKEIEWIKTQQEMPFSFGTIPEGIYGNVNQSEHPVLVGMPCAIMTVASVDADFIYDLAKILDEHQDEWATYHPGAAMYTPEFTAANIVIPLHPGMERYLKEKGLLK